MVYIIRFEEEHSGLVSSGISYVYDKEENARSMLKAIKSDELENYDEDDILEIIENDDEFTIDLGDDYVKFIIERYSIIKGDE